MLVELESLSPWFLFLSPAPEFLTLDNIFPETLFSGSEHFSLSCNPKRTGHVQENDVHTFIKDHLLINDFLLTNKVAFAPLSLSDFSLSWFSSDLSAMFSAVKVSTFLASSSVSAFKTRKDREFY